MPYNALSYREKKTSGAYERDEAARQDWCAVAETLPARRMVVLDESSTHLDMVSAYGRAPRGQRAFVKHRRNYGKNMTLLAGLTLDGISAAMVIEGAVTTEVFVTFVEQVLLPTLQPGDIVILDNLAMHKVRQMEQLLHSKGCQLRFYLPIPPIYPPLKMPSPKLNTRFARYVPRRLIPS